MLLLVCKQGNLHKIKKGIPSFAELGTIPNIMSLVPTYTVGTIFISMIIITIIRSTMIVQRYFSRILIMSPPFLLKAKGNSTYITRYS